MEFGVFSVKLLEARPGTVEFFEESHCLINGAGLLLLSPYKNSKISSFRFNIRGRK